MKIEFEISETQEKVLKEINAYVADKNEKDGGKLLTDNELAKEVFVRYLIQTKQGLVAEEMRK